MPFITERVLPFAVLVGAMFCYLNLSRRWSSWWRAPPASRPGNSSRPRVVIAALIGVATTTIYNPISANLREQSTRLEAELFGYDAASAMPARGFWLRQRSDDGQAVINAKSAASREFNSAA